MAEAAADKEPARGKPVRRLTATELARKLSDILNRVYYQRETVVVERGGKPVCQLTLAVEALSCLTPDQESAAREGSGVEVRENVAPHLFSTRTAIACSAGSMTTYARPTERLSWSEGRGLVV